MKTFTAFSLGLFLLFAGLGTGAAQDKSGMTAPPKVLVVQVEMVKPGKSGAPHLKTESAFVKAFQDAKWSTPYLAMDSLSGPSRSLFLSGYDSFVAWEKDNLAVQKNAALSAAIDRAAIADGELLSGYESSTLVYREDLSLRANGDISQMRYMEISRFKIRSGHEKEWETLVKMYIDGYQKIPNGHWATYESMYGMDNGGVYLVFTPMKSMAEIDSGFADSKTFSTAMGDDGMKKLADLAASCIEQSRTNLFQFNPKMSFPSERWIKVDPSFWKPRMAAPEKKTEAKPAQ